MTQEFVLSKENPHLGGNVYGGDSFTFCPALWEWLVKTFDVESVLDVGCAQGHALTFFYDLGVRAIGIEGLQENAKQSLCPVLIADLTKGPVIFAGVDLVWCCEVVEHVEEKYLKNLLATISVGKILAMTAAEPNQPGHHHVNCKPVEYWIHHLGEYGMEYLPDITAQGKALGPKANHFSWHGLIFRRKQ